MEKRYQYQSKSQRRRLKPTPELEMLHLTGNHWGAGIVTKELNECLATILRKHSADSV
jgi:hypothetical protein